MSGNGLFEKKGAADGVRSRRAPGVGRAWASRGSLIAAIGSAAIVIVGGALVFRFAFEFVDRFLDGAFISWIANQFLLTWNLNEMGMNYSWVLDIEGTKYFFYQLGLCFIVVLAVCTALTAHIYAGRRVRASVSATADMIEAFMTHDLEPREVFPDGYEEVALQMAGIKQTVAEHERSLREEAARKNDLITYLAHDLKTPLTSVIGYLSLLDEIPEMPLEQRCRYTGVALDKAKRLELLTNEFFDITRYNLQHIELELAPVDLSYLLVQLADEFYPVLMAHGNTVAIEVDGVPVSDECPGEPFLVLADADRLARVFNNILKNAIAYSFEGTPIEVRAERVAAAASTPADAGTGATEAMPAQDDTVRIVVSDEGATIPLHRLETIFDKFFRLDETRGTATGGAGLGLAIAREIVELHGGTITATSENGRTSFIIELPAGVA